MTGAQYSFQFNSKLGNYNLSLFTNFAHKSQVTHKSQVFLFAQSIKLGEKLIAKSSTSTCLIGQETPKNR